MNNGFVLIYVYWACDILKHSTKAPIQPINIKKCMKLTRVMNNSIVTYIKSFASINNNHKDIILRLLRWNPSFWSWKLCESTISFLLINMILNMTQTLELCYIFICDIITSSSLTIRIICWRRKENNLLFQEIQRWPHP